MFLGSSNLTQGGLFDNYEANVMLRLTRGASEDDELLAALIEYREKFTARGMPWRRLDAALIDELGTLLARDVEGHEGERRRRLRTERLARRIFGAPAGGLPRAPKKRRRKQAPRSRPRLRSTSSPPAAGESRVLESWSKRLTISDAMRKPPSSHQRKYVILGQAGYDHALNRIAKQKNSPTYLNWSSLTAVIQSRDFTDWTLTLELLEGRRYRLHLASA